MLFSTRGCIPPGGPTPTARPPSGPLRIHSGQWPLTKRTGRGLPPSSRGNHPRQHLPAHANGPPPGLTPPLDHPLRRKWQVHGGRPPWRSCPGVERHATLSIQCHPKRCCPRPPHSLQGCAHGLGALRATAPMATVGRVITSSTSHRRAWPRFPCLATSLSRG